MVLVRVGLILLLLSACQSVPDARHGGVIRDVSLPRASESEVKAAGAEAMSRGAPVNPVAVSDAVQALLGQAKTLLRKEAWWSAIDKAERGLRIDRREPRFYEILAQAYAAMGDRKSAESFARQGVRYCVRGSSTCNFLQLLLSEK